jgi:protein tyrosine kinase
MQAIRLFDPRYIAFVGVAGGFEREGQRHGDVVVSSTGRLRAGDSLGEGRYVLLEELGRGGFAIVWKAKDKVEERHVAIKVLHTNLAGDTIRRERFYRGARAMQRLQHPGVVRVLEPEGEDSGLMVSALRVALRAGARAASGASPLRSGPIALGSWADVLSRESQASVLRMALHAEGMRTAPGESPVPSGPIALGSPIPRTLRAPWEDVLPPRPQVSGGDSQPVEPVGRAGDAGASKTDDTPNLPWATAVGTDTYGRWAAFEVKGVRQRMRWIPAGTF